MPHGFIRVGDVEVVALCDLVADFPRPLSQAFPDVPPERWPAFRERYPEAWGEADDAWLLHDHCFVVRSEGRTILVDTGVGPVGSVGEQWIHESGGLPRELSEARIAPSEVDTVVLTHCHLDHIGWNLRTEDGERRLTFPRARYLLHRADWDAFPERGDDMDRAAFEQSVRPLQEAGVLDLVKQDRALTSTVRLTHAPGHTPGHVVVEIEAGVERAVISGDLANHPVQVTEPSWRASGDMDADVAAETRRRLLERIEVRGETLATAHFPQPFGTIVHEDGERYWSALEPREEA